MEFVGRGDFSKLGNGCAIQKHEFCKDFDDLAQFGIVSSDLGTPEFGISGSSDWISGCPEIGILGN